MDIKEKILEFIESKEYVAMSAKELSIFFGVPTSDKKMFKDILEEMEETGMIFKNKKNKYVTADKKNLILGTVRGNERGFAFFLPEDETKKDVFIPKENMGGAIHGDKVYIKVDKEENLLSEKRAEGKVVKIVERNTETFVGVFMESKDFAFVVPDNKRISGDIFVDKKDFNGAKDRQKVVVKVKKWADNGKKTTGEIIEIIGNIGDPGVDIESIVRDFNISQDFSDEVINEAKSVSTKIDEKERARRRDLTNLQTVTIDGEDAKDLDDAITIEKLESGRYRLGVHIADVSYYVRRGSALDEEALKRSTSVYLVDRVIPMLPAQLSNGICSLNMKEERLAFSVLMEVDEKGEVIDHDICESVINVDERMTYNNVYRILEEDDKLLRDRYVDFIPMFETMKELAVILRDKREERGAIDFNFTEVKIELDGSGKPIELIPRVRTIAEKIIEEFMILCNETVATTYFWSNVPYIYRVHEDPEEEKVQVFAEFIKNMGYNIKGITNLHPKAFQEVLKKASGTREEKIIGTVMLRSMQKAVYTSNNARHFGLASDYYSHFTSPIRRYPDLMIHRIMKEYMNGELTDDVFSYYERELENIAKHCSDQERAADDAEMASKDLKIVQYMKQFEGETFEAVISSVTGFGFFVELDNTVEGLVRITDLNDDYYIFDEKNYRLVGERTGKMYKLGDAVKVVLVKADISISKIDFVLEGTERKLSRPTPKKKKKIDNRDRKKDRKKRRK